MSYIAERRGEEKERRRAEILDAAESLYAEKGWDALTVDQVARSARLSRALVYVYFRDKEELLFAIGERAMRLLRDRFIAAAAGHAMGMDQVEAIGRAYMAYAYEFPHYFDFCTRFQAHSVGIDPGSHEGACRAAGDEAIGTVVQAIQTGIRDGSIRADVGEPMLLAVTLWAFTHGIIQLAMAKGADLARFAISVPDLSSYAFGLIRTVAQCATPGESVVPARTPPRLAKSPRLAPAKAPQSPPGEWPGDPTEIFLDLELTYVW
jgi:TetR/AcrR family transcriptional regulator